MAALALGVAAYASMALWNPNAIDFIANREGFLRSALIIHGAVGTLALALGPFQFVKRLRQIRPQFHRISGRIYLTCILISGVTGLWLSFYTPGGLPATSGFFVLAILWLLTGSLALRAVLKRDYAAHRAWMMRSYALTFGAVTLRIYLGLGVPVAGIEFNQVYGMAAWASWAINLLFVEWLLLAKPSVPLAPN
ncbi:MAG: DUF2306 domain-containing protein [Xanthomonadaceae bacterium]|nr:DUF2306 domain-containing protein [Xanthomonadaceae bacterium]